MPRLVFILSLLVAGMAAPASAQTQKPNHLLGASSPYLLQHLYNPVDWYPWGDEALDKARREDKLIFLSVGYAACHWCHVMEEESFENRAIAKILNDNFVSIKVDRERRPDLDEQFMLVTEALTGSGGWPNSVFLTSNGDPIHAGTYFPPDIFTEILIAIQDVWNTDRHAVGNEAAQLTSLIRDYMNRATPERELDRETIHGFATAIAGAVDPFSGGLGDTAKFPQEPLFLFLLDQAERTGDRDLLQAVTDTLDGMFIGGIHDHVGGGFHRYAVDPEWQIPHFEKMLYTQALSGRLMLRAWEITNEPRYRLAAESTFDYVLRELQSPDGGFYSAQDADSLTANGISEEGAFYLWTEDEMIRAAPQDRVFLDEIFMVTDPGSFEGSNILHMLELPTELQNRGDAAGFVRQYTSTMKTLLAHRNTRPAPFLDTKIVVDWNAAMIETLAEASNALGRPEYYKAAEKAAMFIQGEMVSSEGLKRIYFKGLSSVPAQLSDYAGLGLAYLALHDHAPSSPATDTWLNAAAAMAGEIRNRFQSVEGPYRMTEASEGIVDLKPVDDTEVVSGNALTLALMSRLSNRSVDPETKRQAIILSAAVSGHAAEVPDQRGGMLMAMQELTFGEHRKVRYLTGGAVRLEGSVDRNRQHLVIEVSIKNGWHINANAPLDDYFIPTELGINATPVDINIYPEPSVKSLKFNDKPLALYEGDFTLETQLPKSTGDQIGSATLSLQACSDEICLAPEQVVFTLW